MLKYSGKKKKNDAKKLPKKLNEKQSVFVKYRTRYPTIEEFTN